MVGLVRTRHVSPEGHPPFLGPASASTPNGLVTPGVAQIIRHWPTEPMRKHASPSSQSLRFEQVSRYVFPSDVVHELSPCSLNTRHVSLPGHGSTPKGLHRAR